METSSPVLGEEQRMASSSDLEQRMAPSSDLEQQAAAALRSVTPVITAPAGAGGGAPDRAAAAAAIQRRKAAQRARATDAFHQTLAPARPLADQTILRRLEQLKALKDELRGLEVQLRETHTVQLRKESQCRLARESISEATATTEQLRTSVADFRDKRDNLLAGISEQLPAEPPEAECNEDAEMAKVRKAVLWYEKFLGFRVIGGEGGVKFVFNKIDPQHRDKECSFRISPTLQFMECDHHVRDIEKMVKDLDLSEYLFEFVRMAREKFQSSFMNVPDVSAAPFPSPTVTSVNNKKNVQLLPAKREAASPGVPRRSPRLERMQ